MNNADISATKYSWIPEYKLKYERLTKRKRKRERERERPHYAWKFLMKSLRERFYPPQISVGFIPKQYYVWALATLSR